MKAVAVIFARGGSKGIPGKNVKMLQGKPLIGWSIEQALSIARIERVLVSTDSEDIAEIALQFGAEVPFMRPAELAADSSPEYLAWQHAAKYLSVESTEDPLIMVSLPTTAPLRLPVDVDNCLDLYEAGGADVVITVTDARRSPYFNMVQANYDGLVSLVNSTKSEISRRQDVPVVYDMTTVAYVVSTEYVQAHKSIFDGRVKAVHVPPERAIDIDTQLDFDIAQFLMSRR